MILEVDRLSNSNRKIVDCTIEQLVKGEKARRDHIRKNGRDKYTFTIRNILKDDGKTIDQVATDKFKALIEHEEEMF